MSIVFFPPDELKVHLATEMALFRYSCDHTVFEKANLYLLPVPKSEQMRQRLGNLVNEFKQLVYPPDYNPDGKAVKRKQASDGQTEKRPKVEVSKDELWNHVQKGTLGKLTVPVLKDACRVLGLRSGSKKQELMDALTEYFSEH